MNPNNPNAGEPVNPNRAISSEPAGSSVNPLSNLESVVAAAQQAAAAQTTSSPLTPTETPREQFNAQFGSGSTPPVEAPADTPVVPLEPSINTVDDLLAKGPQVVEASVPVEQTPAEKLKQQIASSVDAFLEEVAKEKAVA